MARARRKDYLRNIKSKNPSGCAWCGEAVPPPVTNMSVCSDACTEALFEGIDDIPPVVPCGDPRSMSEEAKSRAIERMNISYNEWANGRQTP